MGAVKVSEFRKLTLRAEIDCNLGNLQSVRNGVPVSLFIRHASPILLSSPQRLKWEAEAAETGISYGIPQ
jgi:hypothetical protein